ncbi:MAG: hypothetical protein ACRD0N_15830 [Acidimicrobiales bacterium]
MGQVKGGQVARVSRAAVLAVVLLAACSEKSPADRLASAYEKTVAEGTAKLFQRMRITPAADAEDQSPQVITGRGDMDFGKRRGTVTATVNGQEITTVVSGGDVFLRMPNLAVAAAGREWFRMDFEALTEATGVEGLGEVFQSQSNDPGSALLYLEGVAGEVEKIGEERIRGANTTWYGATVDLAKAADAAPDEETAEAIRAQSEVFSLTRMPVEMWLDSEGRVRRILQKIDYSRAAQGGRFRAGTLPASAEITQEYYDFGTAVSVQVPPSDDVAQFSEVLGRIERGEGSGTASPATDALVPRLLSEVPAGYEQQPDIVGDTGPSDLEKAIRDDTDDDAREVLTADRFVAGYQRMWAKGEEATIILFLYEFEEPAGAAHYLQRTLDAIAADGDTETFDVPGVPGGRGLRSTDEEDPAAVVLMTRAGYLAQVVVTGPDASSSLPLDLARQQYEKLG